MAESRARPSPRAPGRAGSRRGTRPRSRTRGLDYISPRRLDDLFSPEIGDRLFRLGEPQGMLEVNGMLVPGKPVDAALKRQTLWLEYHAGVTNASNSVSDNNVQKGI